MVRSLVRNLLHGLLRARAEHRRGDASIQSLLSHPLAGESRQRVASSSTQHSHRRLRHARKYVRAKYQALVRSFAVRVVRRELELWGKHFKVDDIL